MPPTEARPPTSQQAAAITTLDRNVMVVAGAGTGKTTVLVQRFVELLARHPAWPLSAVVAITFTNRAADEMRSRVRQALEQRLRYAPPAELPRWSSLLTQIEAARITTIHGLCADIVRANAAQVGIDPGFDVLDETQAAMLRDDAVTQALAAVVSDSTLSDAERNLAVAVITRYGEYEIRESLKKAALLNADLNAVRDFDALYAEWAAHAERLLRSTPLPALTYTAPNNDDKLAAQYIAAQGNLLRVKNSAIPFDKRLDALTACTQIVLNVGSVKKWSDIPEAKEELGALRAFAKDLFKRIGTPPTEQDSEASDLLRGWMQLIMLTRRQYSAIKRTKNALDYDDLEQFAAQVLAVPTVAARYVGTEFRHVMVDEFQDTNLRQWNIVKALAPVEQAGALFIVGDPKQSIYSFRGADVTVFDRARTEIVAYDGMVLYLTESFRTHKPLVDTLNQMFTTVLSRPSMTINSGVFITFDETQRLLAYRPTPPDAPFIGAFGIAKIGDENQTVSEARAVAQQLRTLVNNRTALVWQDGAYRPVRYGDIALLLRSFQSRVEIFEQALLAEGIPYITLGGRGFFGRREVRDLIVALRALHNPADKLSLAALLHGPLFALSDADLLALRSYRDDDGAPLPLLAALLKAADQQRGTAYVPLVYAADVLQRILPLAGRLPVEGLLHILMSETGYLATLAGQPDGRQMCANVEKLIDQARDSGLTALNLFVRYLNDMTEAEVKEGGVPLDADDAVRVTTIHSSKGLEYPIVWIADAGTRHGGGNSKTLNWSNELGTQLPKPDQVEDENGKIKHPYIYVRNKALAEEREDAESRRVLYVAATRAKDALFISGAVAKDDVAGGWLKLIEDTLPRTLLTPKETQPPAVDTQTPVGTPVTDYPLAGSLPTPTHPARLHLSASDIRTLGRINTTDATIRERSIRKLRQRVFAENSEPVPLLTYDAPRGQVSGRKTGTIIHDALRFGYDALIDQDRPQAEALIRARAWEAAITDKEALDIATDRVIGALKRYNASRLARELRQSKAVYRELPFVYRRDGHVIHGIIDALYRTSDGAWTVVDYKTDYVTQDTLAAQARPYYLQMAVYAEAVAIQTGTTPRVMLVFLHFPDAPVVLDMRTLRAELDNVPFETLLDVLETKPTT